MNHDVPVQSLIDHIRTAVDVDPWAKEMAEELLKEHEPVQPVIDDDGMAFCGRCGEHLGIIPKHSKDLPPVNFCPECGQAAKWD